MRYLFYTQEGLEKSPLGFDVANLQILGEEEAISYEVGLKKLINNNYWIVETGYNIEKIMAKELLSNEVVITIEDIVRYLWNDEKHHYEGNPSNNHIFCKLNLLKNKLNIQI